MFDIGFAELFILSLVALLVLGPERLPQALRTLGVWIGRARRTLGSFQAELEREIGMDEIRREMHNNRILEEARALEQELKSADRKLHHDASALEESVRTAATDPEDPNARQPGLAAPGDGDAYDGVSADDPAKPESGTSGDDRPDPSAETAAAGAAVQPSPEPPAAETGTAQRKDGEG